MQDLLSKTFERAYMRLEQKIYEELKHQNIFTQDQARMLLIALGEAFKRNEELAQILEKTILEIHDVRSRLEFYRALTISVVKGEDK